MIKKPISKEDLAKTGLALEMFKYRTNAGLTISEFAKKLGTTDEVIKRIESANF